MNLLVGCVLLSAACVLAEPVQGTGCPTAASATGDAAGAADANVDHDTCEMLWTDGAMRNDGTLEWPTHTQSLVKSEWDPRARGDIALYTTRAAMWSPEGVEAAHFESARGHADENFSILHDVREYGAAAHFEAKIVADWILHSSSATGVWLQPRAVNMNAVGESCGEDPCTVLLPGVSLPIALLGKHVVYFRRTITGFGYDAASEIVALRGGWQIYGY